MVPSVISHHLSFPADQRARHHHGRGAGVRHPAQHHREAAVWPGERTARRRLGAAAGTLIPPLFQWTPRPTGRIAVCSSQKQRWWGGGAGARGCLAWFGSVPVPCGSYRQLVLCLRREDGVSVCPWACVREVKGVNVSIVPDLMLFVADQITSSHFTSCLFMAGLFLPRSEERTFLSLADFPNVLRMMTETPPHWAGLFSHSPVSRLILMLPHYVITFLGFTFKITSA